MTPDIIRGWGRLAGAVYAVEHPGVEPDETWLAGAYEQDASRDWPADAYASDYLPAARAQIEQTLRERAENIAAGLTLDVIDAAKADGP